MREIKFRAWKKYTQKYLEADELLMNLSNSNLQNLAGGTFRPSDVAIEQYTGLKDKNGVEIYEGDIVKLHVVILSPDDKIGEVKYSPAYGYSIYFTSNRMARQEYWSNGGKHTIEVIGNIHENADLLEEQK